MKIKWLGHSCFLLTSDEGMRVVTDPFDPKVSFPTPAVETDIVTISHQHGDHNYTKALKGSFKVFHLPGEYTECGIAIKGVAAFHDDVGGRRRGLNTLFRLTIDGINILHCGDLGHALTVEQIKEVSPVDVLLVPVGGYYTIDALAALAVVKELHPALVVPMHFKAGNLDFPIATVEPFLHAARSGKEAGSQEIEVTKESLMEKPGIVVLDYPR